MDVTRFPEIMRRLYAVVDELEGMFPGRHFTPDGHMVGSIGEALAAYHYGLKLLPASTQGQDATCGDQKVEIKATQGNVVGLRCAQKHLIVLKLNRDKPPTEIYNGNGDRVWDLISKKQLPSNGQYQVRLSTLKRLMTEVPTTERLRCVHPLE